jgi:hypothetical protein
MRVSIGGLPSGRVYRTALHFIGILKGEVLDTLQAPKLRCNAAASQAFG